MDRVMVEVQSVFDRDLGPHGVPMTDAVNPSLKGEWVATSYFDFVQQAVDDAKADHATKYPADKQHGRVWAVRRARR